MAKKKKKRPCYGPNLAAYDLRTPTHSFVKHSGKCSGTILLPVSSADVDRAIGKAYCRKCGARVGRKGWRMLQKRLDEGVLTTRVVQAPGGGYGLAFRYYRTSAGAVRAADEAEFSSQPSLNVAPPGPGIPWPQAQASSDNSELYEASDNLWGDTLDLAADLTEKMSSAGKKAKRFSSIWQKLVPKPKDDL